MDRAGPPPSVTHCSHGVVGVVHGAAAAVKRGVEKNVVIPTTDARNRERMRGLVRGFDQ